MDKTAEQEWKERAMTFFDKDGIFDYLAGISDFKSALKEEIKAEINECLKCRDSYPKDSGAYAEFSNRANGLQQSFNLIDQVKPKS